MSPTQITTRGSATAFRPPERGTVHARIALEGPKARPVHDAVAAECAAVTRTISELHDPDEGPVTWFSVQDLRTWASRPWNNEGKQLPLVHHAAVGLRVKFADFTALSGWLAAHAGTRGFTVDQVEWDLVAGHRRQLATEVRTEAVHDARSKAQAYADALDLGTVRVVALADAGMLGEGLAPQGGIELAAFSRGSAAGGQSQVDLAPRDIEVTVEVDARFEAGAAAPVAV